MACVPLSGFYYYASRTGKYTACRLLRRYEFIYGLSRRQEGIVPHSSPSHGLLPYCRFRLPPQLYYVYRSFRPLPLCLRV
nr:MAG TPA: hypothetical protein [Caudoviricetes sp.]